VVNTVAEVTSSLAPEALLARLLAIEKQAGRVRDGGTTRTLDLDLLSFGEWVGASPDLTLPHPRALGRAFVLGPWAEIAPLAMVPGTGGEVLRHAARLRARSPEAFVALTTGPALPLPDLRRRPQVLPDRAALDVWRAGVRGSLALVPTMGALHAGHASNVRRARAVCEAVLATVFVNPLQFGPKEDSTRYPRTFDADLALLAASGADAVYVPAADDLYPPGFSTTVTPAGPARGFEGDVRPGHFAGVATVVQKLFQRARPDRAWFGQKDAQQVAVVRRMVRDLDLPIALEICTTVRDEDGLALSSRNRYLAPEERVRALALPAALADLQSAAAAGERDVVKLLAPAIGRLTKSGLAIDYIALVNPETMEAVGGVGDSPVLALAAVRAGTTRLLDNAWVVAP
jgi:pantoate--beta-alanine ligase